MKRAAALAALAALSCSGPSDAELLPPPLLLASISAGNYSTCGIGLDGAGWCWGDGTQGQLGSVGHESCTSIPGEQPCAWQPAAVSGSRAFATASVGGAHACGIAQGAIWCWGDDEFGQLGDNAVGETCGVLLAPCARLPTRAQLGFAVVQLSAGGGHSCAIREDGLAYCWGYGAYGRLGNGSNDHVDIPTPVSGALSFSSVAAGGSHTCGIARGGVLYCWGYNHLGQLGDGTTETRSLPTPVATDLRFLQVSVGSALSCAIATDHRVHCWGAAAGLLPGAPPLECEGYPCHAVPAPAGGGLLFSAISVGSGFACGVTDSESYCWGEMSGLDATIDSPAEFGAGGSSGGARFVTISAGLDHACGITVQHEAFCWGNDYHGMLGDGIEPGQTSGPVRVRSPEP